MEKHPRASISIKLSQTSQWQYQVWALSLKSSLGVQVRGIWQRPRWKIAFLVKRLIFTRKLNHSICQLRLLCFSVFLGEVLGFGPGSAEIRSNSLWREWSEGHGVGQARTEKILRKFHTSLGLITFFYYYLLYFFVCVAWFVYMYFQIWKYFFFNCFMYLCIFFLYIALKARFCPSIHISR